MPASLAITAAAANFPLRTIEPQEPKPRFVASPHKVRPLEQKSRIVIIVVVGGAVAMGSPGEKREFDDD